MLVWKLAARNLLRHKRRTLITASAITLSYAILLVFMGLGDGSHAQMVDMGVRMGAGHVVVQPPGYRDDQTIDHLIDDPTAVLAALAAGGVEGETAPRLHASGLARAGNKSVGVAIAGVDPGREARTNDLASAERRVAGGWLRSRAELPFESLPSDLYLGQVLAETLEVTIGDRVTLTVQPRGTIDPRSAAFLVRGIFRTGTDELDGFLVHVPLEDAQALLGVGPAVSQIALLLADERRTPAVRDAAAAALAGLPVEVLPWQEALPELFQFIVLDDGSFYMMTAVVFLLVALGVFNTVLTSVLERTREFGLLTSLGASPWRVLGVVLAEAALVGLVATVAGVGLGLALHHPLAVYGLDYGALLGGDSFDVAGVNLAMVIYSRLDPGKVAVSVALVLGIVLLSALGPAVRAARMPSLEALHHV